MAANAKDLCLAATVAGDLGIASDATVERLVTAASQAIANHCGRVFHKETVTERPTGTGRAFLSLDRPPVVTVTSVTELGTVLEADEYEVQDAAAGILLRKGTRWPYTGQSGGNVTLSEEHLFGQSGDEGIEVVYSGGYVTPGQKSLDDALTVTLPEDIQEAAVLTAVALYRRRGTDPNIASESLGDWSVTYAHASSGRGGIPDAARELLAPYVRVF